MDKIVEEVMKILEDRMNKEYTIDLQADTLEYDYKQLVYAKNILVFNVSSKELLALEEFKKTSFTEWILHGMSLGNSFSFFINDAFLQTIPLDVINKLPVKCYNDAQQRLYYFKQKAITYKEVSAMEKNSILLLEDWQLLTLFAKEYCQKNQINICERY